MQRDVDAEEENRSIFTFEISLLLLLPSDEFHRTHVDLEFEQITGQNPNKGARVAKGPGSE